MRFDYKEFDDNMRKYFYAVDAFTKAGILVPGYKTKKRGFWLFPIAVPNKLLYVDYFLCRGINAYRGATQLRYVAHQEGRKEAPNSKWLMDHIVYLPIHSGQSDKDLRETVDRVIESYHRLSEYLNQNSLPKPDHEMSRFLFERAKL
jgi:dTDP-4-amino-4,6-dideoxygalactose transaminase